MTKNILVWRKIATDFRLINSFVVRRLCVLFPLFITSLGSTSTKTESFEPVLLFDHSVSATKVIGTSLNAIYLYKDSRIGNDVTGSKILKLDLKGQVVWELEQAINEEFISAGTYNISDVNKDGTSDFIFLSSIYEAPLTEKYFCTVIDGRSGEYFSRSPCSLPHTWGLLSDSVGDFNNDGEMDAVYVCGLNIRLFSVESGKIIWAKNGLLTNAEFKKVVPFDVYPSPSSPRIFYNPARKRYEIFLTFGPYIWSLNAKTGSINWRRKEEEDIKYKEQIEFIGGPFIKEWDAKEPPYVIAGILLPGLVGFSKVGVCAYNAFTGKPIWKTYLGEYRWWYLSTEIDHFYFGDIPVLLVFVRGSDEIFLIEGKNGFIIYREKLPFFVTSSFILNTDEDSLAEIILLGSTEVSPGGVHLAKSFLFVYDIEPDHFNKKIFAKNKKYDLVSYDSLGLEPEHYKKYYSDMKQIYKSPIPDLTLKFSCDAEEDYKFKFADDIDGDGFVEVVMLNPYSPGKDRRMRVLRIIPVSNK